MTGEEKKRVAEQLKQIYEAGKNIKSDRLPFELEKPILLERLIDYSLTHSLRVERFKRPGILAVILLLAVILTISATLRDGRSAGAYVAGTSKEASVYLIGKDDGDNSKVSAVEVKKLTRGTPIRRYQSTREVDGDVYVLIKEQLELPQIKNLSLDDKKADYALSYYIKDENIASSPEDVVRESEVFVRTPVTIYAEADGPAIASFAPKGSCLKVEGYDKLNRDGSVNKYRVKYLSDKESSDKEKDGEYATGYVYGKYLVDTQKKADAVYKENGIYKKAKKDKYVFNLYGGKASHLDYYPYDKPTFEDNEFCDYARTMYINCVAAVNPKQYVKLINKTDCNAVVIDIKDGVLAYKSEVAKEYSPKSYKNAYTSVKKYRKGVDAYRKTGAYLIGRIVVFNDPLYAKDHPEDCIKYNGSTVWPSAYSRKVWEYNVRLAQEAIEKFGFNEIQFDYVRFPESSYEMSKSGKVKWRNKYDEEKGQAVQNFCFYAADQIHEAGAYFSIDVFGESAYGYMTAYGQYWMGLSNIVDAISAMPYTDHTGGEGAWAHPYDTVYKWAKRAKSQEKKLANPAAARTWITGYDTPYWAPEYDYGKNRLRSQVKALKDAGLNGGFIPWNSGSSIAKYKEYKKVWDE